MDIVFPDRNEDRFLAMAEKLGWQGICFVYEKATENRLSSKLPTASASSKRCRHSDLAIVSAPADPRLVMERERPDIIFGVESHRKPDSLHRRSSGLNQITCNLAKSRGVCIGFAFSLLLQDSGRIAGRMQENIRCVRRFGVGSVIASCASDPYQMRSPQDLKSLFCTLGMHPKDADAALQKTAELVERTRKARKGEYLGEGIERMSE